MKFGDHLPLPRPMILSLGGPLTFPISKQVTLGTTRPNSHKTQMTGLKTSIKKCKQMPGRYLIDEVMGPVGHQISATSTATCQTGSAAKAVQNAAEGAIVEEEQGIMVSRTRVNPTRRTLRTVIHLKIRVQHHIKCPNRKTTMSDMHRTRKAPPTTNPSQFPGTFDLIPARNLYQILPLTVDFRMDLMDLIQDLQIYPIYRQTLQMRTAINLDSRAL